MYTLIDRPLAEISPARRLLVQSMRVWVHAMAERICPRTALAPAFLHWNAGPALEPFIGMMTGFNRHGLHRLSFCAPHCPRVSEHEAIILQALTDANTPRARAVEGVLSMLVAESAIAPIAAAFVQIGRAMEDAGLAVGGTG